MSQELIDVLANEPKIVKYLDIPIQHINDDILRRMNRRGTGEEIRALFKKLRERIPGLVLRTSLITGLPGEGEALGLIAHMDTSPAVSGDHIKPRIVTYPGGVLELGTSSLSPTDYPFLEEYIGQELIVTDGTTLLGADDKAGVAEIVTLCEYLLAHPEVCLLYTSDAADEL